MWGGGSEGQLGLGDIWDKSTPTLLSTDNKVISVACGYYHTAFVTGKSLSQVISVMSPLGKSCHVCND